MTAALTTQKWWPSAIGITPVYFDSSVALFHADCQDVFATLPNRSVEHVITDPPYEERTHRHGRVDRTAGIRLSKLSFDSLEKGVGRAFCAEQFARVAQQWILVFCETEASGAWREEFEANAADWVRAQWWVKPDASPQFTGDRPAVPGEIIATAWASPGTRKSWNGGGRRGIYTVANKPRHSSHETEKPLSLMENLVELFTARGDVILDPFAGSGTTGVAAKKRGRRAILIERNERYLEEALARLKSTKEQFVLFEDPKSASVGEQVSLGLGLVSEGQKRNV